MRIHVRPKRLAAVAALAMILTAATAWAVLPPYVYKERIQNSQVKVMAVIQQVVLESSSEYLSRLVVTFRPVDGGEAFSGRCATFDDSWQKMMMGGEIYYQPVPGHRVYVTIDMPGGNITSLSPLTPELKFAIENAPNTLIYGMGRVYLEKPKP